MLEKKAKMSNFNNINCYVFLFEKKKINKKTAKKL